MADIEVFQNAIIKSADNIIFQLNRLGIKLEKLEYAVATLLTKNEDGELELPSKDFYDTSDVCRMLNVTERTVQRYRNQKIIPYFKYNHKIYYPRSEFDKYLKKYFSTYDFSVKSED